MKEFEQSHVMACTSLAQRKAFVKLDRNDGDLTTERYGDESQETMSRLGRS